jgi:hypothetical protein
MPEDVTKQVIEWLDKTKPETIKSVFENLLDYQNLGAMSLVPMATVVIWTIITVPQDAVTSKQYLNETIELFRERIPIPEPIN